MLIGSEGKEEKKGVEVRKRKKSRIEIYGEEVIEKTVKPAGNSGRVYLPGSWAGRLVKIVRIN